MANNSTTKLHDANVLVLGGTSGIGFGVAKAALEQGARVCIASSRPEKLDDALRRLRSACPDQSSKLSGQPCDLAVLQDLESNVDKLLQFAAKDAKIDHVVFTAGDAVKTVPIGEITADTLRQFGGLRLSGAFMLGKLAPKFMNSGPGSSITFTSGSNTTKPNPDWTLIAAWGGALEGAMRGLAVDLAPIRVNAVSPGAVNTELFGGIPKEKLDGVLQMMAKASLVGEVGTPEDLAESYLHLMKNKFITGTITHSDGGRLLK